MKVGIVMPAYNEEKRIGQTLKDYSEFLDSKLKKNQFDYVILVVINATTDKTKDIVKTAKKKNKRIDYVDLVKGGKGYALIEGFKLALNRDFDLIGFVDADEATSAKAFYDLIENIGSADAVIADRYAKGAIVQPKQSFQRIIASRIFNFFVRCLFLMPYRDTQCGAKLIKREALRAIIDDLGETHWSFDVDLLFCLRRKGFFVKEYPTIWQDKKDSKLNLKKASIQMFFSIVQLRILNSPFKRTLKIIRPAVGALWRRLVK